MHWEQSVLAIATQTTTSAYHSPRLNWKLLWRLLSILKHHVQMVFPMNFSQTVEPLELAAFLCNGMSSQQLHSLNVATSISRCNPETWQAEFQPRELPSKSLLCSSFKLFERLILNTINPIIDPLLPTEQAGFRKKTINCRPSLPSDSKHRASIPRPTSSWLSISRPESGVWHC